MDPSAKIFDYPDLFSEAAHALRGRQHFEEALRYYEPLQQVGDDFGGSILMELALCYRAIGFKARAENCYKTTLEHDPGNTEARVALWNMSREPAKCQTNAMGTTDLSSVFKQKSRRRLGVSATGSYQTIAAHSSEYSMLADSAPCPSTIKTVDLNQDSAQQEEVQALFGRWQVLSDQRHAGEMEAAAFFEAAKLLLQIFRDNRVFYPNERHHRFYGYSKLARAIAARPKHERGALTAITDSILGMVGYGHTRHTQGAE